MRPLFGLPHRPIGASTERRVCLLDDDPTVLSSYARVLRYDGFDVHEAHEPRSAINAVCRGDVDLVICDLHLSDDDGLEVLKTVRAVDPDLPVMLMTGRADLPSAIKALEYGALRYLIKPIDRADFLKAVDEGVLARANALSRRAAMRQAEVVDERALCSRGSMASSFARASATMTMKYQPIVHLSEREVFAYEALVRSSGPCIRTPLALFATAERLGQIPALGRRIRAMVADTITSTTPRPMVTVNLHPTDLVDEELYSPGAPLSLVAEHVVLELSESAPLEAVGGIRARLASLRALGFKIAIDDLGAGYSALGTLAQIHPDMVKIDQSLVRGVGTDRARQKVVAMLGVLCRDLGITLVAEGVETVVEREALVDAGVDFFQGYLFAKPGDAYPSVAWDDREPARAH